MPKQPRPARFQKNKRVRAFEHSNTVTTGKVGCVFVFLELAEIDVWSFAWNLDCQFRSNHGLFKSRGTRIMFIPSDIYLCVCVRTPKRVRDVEPYRRLRDFGRSVFNPAASRWLLHFSACQRGSDADRSLLWRA
jgi:hypothetical protein